MKDWKTYAIIALSAWCAMLQFAPSKNAKCADNVCRRYLYYRYGNRQFTRDYDWDAHTPEECFEYATKRNIESHEKFSKSRKSK